MNPNVYVTYWGHQFDQPVGIVIAYPKPISTSADIDTLREMLAEHLNTDKRLGTVLFEIISWQRLEDEPSA